MSLIILPIELALDIYLYLDHGSQVNFSLTCKRFAPLLSDVAREHKRYHERFHRGSSRQSQAVTKLLHVAFEDPSVIWHLRTFDICESSVIRISAPTNEAFEAYLQEQEVLETPALRARDRTVEEFLKWTQRTPHADLWNELVKWERFHNQAELCEVLLLALCPRLKGLTFHGFPATFRLQHSYAHTYRSYGKYTCSRPSKLSGPYRDSAAGVRFIRNIPINERLSLLSDTIRTFQWLEKRHWPLGLRHLRRIYVGEIGDAAVHPFGVATLLSLPSIESLHLAHFEVSNEEFVSEKSHLESVVARGKSTVQHLFFGTISRASVKHIIDLALGASELKTLVVQEQRCMLEILGPVAKSHGSTLEHALFQRSKSCYTFPAHSPRSPHELRALACLTSVQIMTLNLSDLIIVPEEAGESSRSLHDPYIFPPSTDRSYPDILDNILRSMPRHLRTLILQPGINRALCRQDLRIVDDAFCHLITGRLCPDLKRICFDNTTWVYCHQDTLPRTVALAASSGLKVDYFSIQREKDRFFQPLVDDIFEV